MIDDPNQYDNMIISFGQRIASNMGSPRVITINVVYVPKFHMPTQLKKDAKYRAAPPWSSNRPAGVALKNAEEKVSPAQ